MAEKEKYYMFVDECGDSFLDNIDEDFPVFTLCGIIVSKPQLKALEKKVAELKALFWGDRNIILHSRDIRKHQHGFEILLNPEVKRDFYERINAIMGEEGAFTIVSCSILKWPFIERYGKDGDVYGLALSRLIERSIFYLDEIGNEDRSDLTVIMEMRGKKEDKELTRYYETFKTKGTKWLTPERLNSHIAKFSFLSKKQNVTCLQVADLIAYPIARYVLNPKAVNLAYDVFQCNIFTDKDSLLGLKIIPKGV
ncbi:MAG: DUF3800 domain-containing protein [Bacteroidales bacterium]|nr:DUF3800 domain-containing protein [Bacteroidales bacterium]